MKNERYLISQSCLPRRCQFIPPQKGASAGSHRITSPKRIWCFAPDGIRKSFWILPLTWLTRARAYMPRGIAPTICMVPWMMWFYVVLLVLLRSGFSWIWGSSQGWVLIVKRYSNALKIDGPHPVNEMDFISYGNLVQWHSASFYIILGKGKPTTVVLVHPLDPSCSEMNSRIFRINPLESESQTFFGLESRLAPNQLTPSPGHLRWRWLLHSPGFGHVAGLLWPLAEVCHSSHAAL